MALWRFIWHTTLLCIVQVCSMPTKCKFQRRLVETCYHLLETMGGTFPLQCLEDNVSVTFPTGVFKSSPRQQENPNVCKAGGSFRTRMGTTDVVYEHTTAIEKSIYITLKYIDSMFDNDGIPDQWTAQDKLENFHHIIFRLIEENSCIMDKTQESLDDFFSREASLRAYFDKIATVLKEKGFQYCAWEFARKEILRALQFILKEDFHSTWARHGAKHEFLK